MSSPLAPIWITSKARMNAERRLKRYALLSHLLLTWYAFWSIAVSVYQDDIGDKIGDLEASKAALILSVLTFGLSLVIYGFRFEERASTYRECYLRFHALFRSDKTESEKLSEYHRVLEHYPNHSDKDYIDALVVSYNSGQSIENTVGVVPVTKGMKYGYYLRKSTWYISTFLLFGAPVIAIFLL